jgi:hypothetical protein
MLRIICHLDVDINFEQREKCLVVSFDLTISSSLYTITSATESSSHLFCLDKFPIIVHFIVGA